MPANRNDERRQEAAAREFWEKNAARYDAATAGLFGRPMPRAIELTAAGVSGAGDVLEVAAGTGLFTQHIAPRVTRVIAVDYAGNMLDVLRARLQRAGVTNVEILQRDLHEPGFPAASFDVVVAANVLHLVPDLQRALTTLHAVLRPGGRLIAPTFVHGETWFARLASRVLARLGQPIHHRFTTASLRGAVEDGGFSIARVETIPGPIPIVYVEATRRPCRAGNATRCAAAAPDRAS